MLSSSELLNHEGIQSVGWSCSCPLFRSRLRFKPVSCGVCVVAVERLLCRLRPSQGGNGMKCPFHTAPWRTRDYDARHDELAEDPWTKDPWNRPCAFVVTVFGHDAGYCVDAAVLGQSIQATGTKHRMILLKNEGRG